MSETSHSATKRVIHYRFGDPAEVLRVEAGLPNAELTPGEVRLRATYAAVHPGDLQLVLAKYSDGPAAIPGGRVPGLEGAGTVIEAAPGALDGTGIALGDRVAFFSPAAWQSEPTVPASSLLAIPDDIADDIAAHILINTITARHVLRTGLATLSDRPASIVQTAAASAVGKLITVFALQEGLHPVRLVRSEESARRLAGLIPGGRIVDVSQPEWRKTLDDAAGGAVRLVLDGAGGAMIEDMSRSLASRGVIMSYGLLGGRPADLAYILQKSLTLRGVTIGTWRTDTSPEDQQADVAAAIDVARSRPQLFGSPSIFGLNDLPAGLRAVGAPAKLGDVLLKL